MSSGPTISLAHGNGGRLTHELVAKVFASSFKSPELAPMEDGARIGEFVFTTDSHVVKPAFFPGGDIGKLAVAGTINDLAVMGAKPLYLSCGFIIEEGLEIETLRRVVDSMAKTAENAGVRIVTGDTKVVERGAADKLFINTAGIGSILPNAPKGRDTLRPGDKVILSGSVGDHGIAIYAGREGIQFETDLKSDCAVIYPLVERAMSICSNVRIMRDPTRGGLATTLNEFVTGMNVGMELFEERIPVKEQVQAACELLGFDPLTVANEGKLVLVVPGEASEKVLAALRSHELGRDAAIIGEINEKAPGKVVLRTVVGGHRILDMLVGDMLPRIC